MVRKNSGRGKIVDNVFTVRDPVTGYRITCNNMTVRATRELARALKEGDMLAQFDYFEKLVVSVVDDDGNPVDVEELPMRDFSEMIERANSGKSPN